MKKNKSTNHTQFATSYSLTIGWLYPELMNTYGDRGNIIALSKRCNWRNIKTEVLMLNIGFDKSDLKKCDLILMGGAQDTQQEAVSKDLFEKKDPLKDLMENGTPGLYICGAYQFLGNYYKEANGKIIGGLNILDLYTENPGADKKRLVGNIVIQPNFELPTTTYPLQPIVGFENHGGRTYLGKNILPFGKVIKGFGNNGKDGLEGAVYKNSFGTYLHGPILPKNPKFADYLIQKALELKYKSDIELERLDDTLETQARLAIAKRLSIAI